MYTVEYRLAQYSVCESGHRWTRPPTGPQGHRATLSAKKTFLEAISCQKIFIRGLTGGD